VYPNPAVDRITLRYTGKMDIQTILITDIFGKTVFMYEMNLGESALPDVPVANLPAGLYCLMLKTSGEAVVAKFMKR
jgi:hypothetical protein